MLRRPGFFAGLGLLVGAGPRRRSIRLAAALPAGRPDPGAGTRGRGEPAARRQAQRRQSDRPVHRLSAGRPASIAPETLEVIAQAHQDMEEQPGIANVWSLETLRRWLAEKLGKPDVATLKQYVDLLPPFLVRRFVAKDRDAASSPAASPTRTPASCCRSSSSSNARLECRCARSIPAIRSKSRAFR